MEKREWQRERERMEHRDSEKKTMRQVKRKKNKKTPKKWQKFEEETISYCFHWIRIEMEIM